MRKKIVFILCAQLFIFSIGLCQSKSVVCGKIKSSEDFIVHIYEPVNGFYNMVFFDSTKKNSVLINGKDSIFKAINIDKPAFVTVYFTTGQNEFISRSDILLFPGDSVHLYFDLDSNNQNSTIYSGDNWSGQKLFNEINYYPYNKFIPVFDALDKLPENKETLVNEIKEIALKLKSRFDSLQSRDLITEGFDTYIGLYFRSSIYNQAINSLLRKAPKQNILSKGKKDSIISALFTIQPATDKRLKGLGGDLLYLYDYYAFLSYKKLNLKTINDWKGKTRNFHVDGMDYLIQDVFIPITYIENNQDRQDLWALWILVYFGYPGMYDFSVARQYDSIFPNNKWSPLFVKQYKVSKSPTNIEYKLQSPISFLDTNKSTTLKGVIDKLPSENPVFMDIWATWCYPCIAGFGYNKALDSFLINQGITRLYISLDSKEDSQKWQKAVSKYALGGYHILASPKLKEEIKHKIYKVKGNEGMGIPRYVLFYKGKILIDNAISPSELDLLKQQLSDVLQFYH